MAKSNKYIRKFDINKLFKIGIVIILLFAIFAVWYHFNFNKKKENFNIATPSLIYFSSENCGHCKKFTETWESIKHEDIIKKKIVDGTAEFKAVEDKFNITHFPTILLVNGDKTIEYDGERTEDNIVKWLNDNIVVAEAFKNKKNKLII
jgi:thioredoxin-like negative regulator of GroEL